MIRIGLQLADKLCNIRINNIYKKMGTLAPTYDWSFTLIRATGLVPFLRATNILRRVGYEPLNYPKIRIIQFMKFLNHSFYKAAEKANHKTSGKVQHIQQSLIVIREVYDGLVDHGVFVKAGLGLK